METDQAKTTTILQSSRRGRQENLRKGKKKGELPSRKLSEQKVKEFCCYYLMHGESIKAAAVYVGLSPTYAYEFFKKPVVQAILEKLRAELDAKLLDAAANQYICTRQFIDENIAPIIANPYPHPKRGFSDQVAAARLAADIGGLTTTSQRQQAPILNA